MALDLRTKNGKFQGDIFFLLQWPWAGASVSHRHISSFSKKIMYAFQVSYIYEIHLKLELIM